MNKGVFEIPILFIIFNRPDVTQRVFDEIRKIKPRRLFVVADGPRSGRENEKEKCQETRLIIDQVDWECEVRRNYSDVNLGCKCRVSSGIDWFFANVEMGIILEDDCLPEQSFFPYCENLLRYYQHDERIMLITGDNFQFGKVWGEGSYYFSRFCHIWGWASWRRAWEKYDVEMKSYDQFKRDGSIDRVFDDLKMKKYWLDIFDKVLTNQIDTWDYQLTYALWQSNGLSIIPNVNLISNIGFGAAATHTKREGLFSNMKTVQLNQILHPKEVALNKQADNAYASKYFKMTYVERVYQYVLARFKSVLDFRK